MDQKNFLGVVLLVLPRTSDSIPHGLLIARMYTFGFSIDAVIFFHVYLKRHKQNVTINGTHSILLSEVPQSLILGPRLFNIFINDLYLWI